MGTYYHSPEYGTRPGWVRGGLGHAEVVDVAGNRATCTYQARSQVSFSFYPSNYPININ
jgi:hypothetical protein